MLCAIKPRKGALCSPEEEKQDRRYWITGKEARQRTGEKNKAKLTKQ